ncbi:MAG: BrnT family toxin [Blastomonas fulva]|uniref:BrnT family toxin n=1 Tax=Blastomonas TaxID=150203 RepID=UPI00336A0319
MIEIPDDRFVYGEDRIVSFGELDGRAVAIVWTGRGYKRRMISMRHVHAEELENRRRALD